ncbi:DsbC family protein [Glaciecola sp.]|jgi:thiol:disulfide interchange protein DsbC|uniref:DsbC family protein n=1 Tax=Glaciecola sp. MF2-115 TaxID=3384827 RepID=UPI00398947DC
MKRVLFLLTLAFFATHLSAQQDDLKVVENNIKQANDKLANANIVVVRELSEHQLPGLYEVRLDGRTLVVTKDGTKAIIGEVFDLQKMINLTRVEQQKSQVVLVEKELTKMTKNDFVTYPAKGETVGKLYVFSDTTCGYCKKMHLEVENYQNAGIEVNYIPYPRNRLVDGDPAFERMKQVMCASNRTEAMTRIKAGTDNDDYVKNSYDPSCVETVLKGRAAGERIGLEGTPFMYLSKGEMQIIPGYQPSSAVISFFKS